MARTSSPHPATARAFDWDEHNVAKLEKRGYRRNKRTATATWLMIGRDDGGRSLAFGILWQDENDRILRAITGWPE